VLKLNLVFYQKVTCSNPALKVYEFHVFQYFPCTACRVWAAVLSFIQKFVPPVCIRIDTRREQRSKWTVASRWTRKKWLMYIFTWIKDSNEGWHSSTNWCTHEGAEKMKCHVITPQHSDCNKKIMRIILEALIVLQLPKNFPSLSGILFHQKGLTLEPVLRWMNHN